MSFQYPFKSISWNNPGTSKSSSGGGGGGGGTLPAGLILDLDAANYTSGTTWTDASGGGHNFTFNTAPTTSGSGNSKLIHLNNTTVKATGTMPASGSKTIVLFGDFTTIADVTYLFFGNVNDKPGMIWYGTAFGINGIAAGFDIASNYDTFTISDVNFKAPNMITMSLNSSTGLISIYRNGVFVGSSTKTAQNNATIHTLAGVGGGTSIWKVNKYMWFDSVLSDADVLTVFNLYKSRLGL